MKEHTYSPECYFKNPETGERGWTIEFPEVTARTKKEAAEKIKQLPNFDCFIEWDWEDYNDDSE